MQFLRLFSISLAIWLLGQVHGEIARADGPADGEREFVRQLQSRQFYELAEQYCIRQSENCRTPDTRAVWQILLADSRELHAWNLHEPGRSQLLVHATESITQFIRKESPGAEPDLLLRVRQIELLSTIVRIDAIRMQFGPKSKPNSLATQAMAEGFQLAEALPEQIEQIRRSIDRSIAREARDRARYVAAELLLTQARQDPTDGALMDKATAAADQLMKSSGDNEIRFKARCLLAESLLDNKDEEGFDLLAISLGSMADNQSQKMTVAALKIRGLLQREQPSEALQYCLNSEKQSLRSEELSTLRLGSLLQLFELLYKLDAPELRQKTADEFRSINQRLTSATDGVWKECCDRIALRFEHVEQFGPEAATAIESVTDLVVARDFAEARRTLLEMRSSFERNSPQIAATLSMQSGDLAIRLGDWTSAESDLASAVQLFQTTGDREQEAASDLLRTYALGRKWDAEQSGNVEVRDSLEAAYRASLDRHIEDYSDQTTSTKAHEWHAMLLRATDPVTAASELLWLVDSNSEERMTLLIQSGEILIETSFSPLGKVKHIDQERLKTALKEWSDKADTTLAKNAAVETTSSADTIFHPLLEIQRLLFSLTRRWSAQDDWQKLAAETTRNLDAIATAAAIDVTDKHRDSGDNVNVPSTGPSSQRQVQIDQATASGHAILVLAACRQLLAGEAIKESRNILKQQPAEFRRLLVEFLLHQASDTNNPIPGDPQLGFLAIDLLKNDNSSAMPTDRRLVQLSALLKASKVAASFQQFDADIGNLTTMPLTDTQLQATASILQQRSEVKTGNVAPTESVKRFWRSVLEKSRPGEDQWLEASLQLATIAVAERKFQEAEKVLNVINALHPEWGTSERRDRAAALKVRLESAE